MPSVITLGMKICVVLNVHDSTYTKGTNSCTIYLQHLPAAPGDVGLVGGLSAGNSDITENIKPT